MLKNFTYAIRTLRKSPGLVIAVILSIGLGVGINSTFFALVLATLLRDVTATNPEQLVRVEVSSRSDIYKVSYPNYEDLRSAQGFQSLAAYRPVQVNVRIGEPIERGMALMTSDNFFHTLGVKAGRGRVYGAAELRESHAVALISADYWRRRLASDPNAVGRVVNVNGEPFTIIGILPRDYRGVTGVVGPELYIPISPAVSRDAANRGRGVMNLIGRLAPGRSAEEAQASVQSVSNGLQQQYPTENENLGRRIRVYPVADMTAFLGGERVPNAVFGFLGVLLAAGCLLLLIACANITGLLLARGSDRSRELSIRLALGASRGQLIRQLLAEALLLTSLSAVCGLGLTYILNRVLERMPLPVPGPLDLQLDIDYRVLLYALSLVIVSAILAGLWPALRATRLNLANHLKTDKLTGSRGRKLLPRDLLVGGQFAVTVILLVASILFLQTLVVLSNVDPGFDVDNTLVARLDLRRSGYTDVQKTLLLEQAVERIQKLPHVQSASVASIIQLNGDASNAHVFIGSPTGQSIDPYTNNVGPRYFETMGIPLLRGREFTSADRTGAPLVAIINETFAYRHYRDTDPIGQRIYYDAGRPVGLLSMEIVGVVRDSKYFSFAERPRLLLYRPYQQDWGEALHVRVAGSAPETLVKPVRDAVAEVDKTVPVEVKTMKESVSGSLSPSRIAAVVLGALSLLGLVLAGTGLYGSLAYAISQRAPEYGLRIALGAPTSSIFRQVVRRGLIITGCGACVGLAAALVVSRGIVRMIAGIQPSAPVTYLWVLLIIIIVGLCAVYPPAHRATRVDPLITLKQQ